MIWSAGYLKYTAAQIEIMLIVVMILILTLNTLEFRSSVSTDRRVCVRVFVNGCVCVTQLMGLWNASSHFYHSLTCMIRCCHHCCLSIVSMFAWRWSKDQKIKSNHALAFVTLTLINTCNHFRVTNRNMICIRAHANLINWKEKKKRGQWFQVDISTNSVIKRPTIEINENVSIVSQGTSVKANKQRGKWVQYFGNVMPIVAFLFQNIHFKRDGHWTQIDLFKSKASFCSCAWFVCARNALVIIMRGRRTCIPFVSVGAYRISIILCR